MSAATAVRLAVQADDLGGAPAFTDGILDCFRAGALTQASVIPVAPDAERALAAAQQAALPIGVHLTLMSEWPGDRWRPFTAGPSLRASDGALHPDLTQLRAHAARREAAAELDQQIRFVRERGVPRFVDCHQHVFDETVLRQVCLAHALPSRDLPTGPGALRLGSVWHLSVVAEDAAGKAEALRRHVRALPPGEHLIVAHPATDSPRLANLCPATSRRWKWARAIRLSDTEALLAVDLPRLCAEAGVSLVASGNHDE